jgi:hypothetical protein
MAAISNNKYDIMVWMEKVFLSCNTIEHLLNMRKLVNNFQRIHDEKRQQVIPKNLHCRINLKLRKLRYDNKY